MKKSILALAVGGALMVTGTATHAGAELYGSLRVHVAHVSPDEGSSTTAVSDGFSRFGFRGSEDLGNGMSAFAHLEFRVDTGRFNDTSSPEDPNNVNGRLAYVGLSGGFGTLSGGTQWGTYTNFGFSAVDRFIIFSPSAHSYIRYRDTHSVQWASGNLGPVSLGAQIRMDPGLREDGASKSVDDLSFGASVELGAATLQGAINRDQHMSDSTWIVAVSVDAAPGLTLAAAYEDVNLGEFGGGDHINAYIGYTVNDTTLHAAWGRASPDEGSSENEYVLGLIHGLSARTSIYVEHQNDVFDNSGTVAGFRHNF